MAPNTGVSTISPSPNTMASSTGSADRAMFTSIGRYRGTPYTRDRSTTSTMAYRFSSTTESTPSARGDMAQA